MNAEIAQVNKMNQFLFQKNIVEESKEPLVSKEEQNKELD